MTSRFKTRKLTGEDLLPDLGKWECVEQYDGRTICGFTGHRLRASFLIYDNVAGTECTVQCRTGTVGSSMKTVATAKSWDEALEIARAIAVKMYRGGRGKHVR